MKKMTKLIAWVLFAFMLTGLLAGCAGETAQDTPAPAQGGQEPAQDTQTPAAPPADGPGDEPIRIGVSFATEVAARFRFDERFMLEKAEELGVELLVQWANYDATRQTNQVENLITQGVDAIIIIGVSNNISPLIYRVRETGIPVVSYDQFILYAPVDAHLDRDNFDAGRIQIEAAIAHTGGQGNFVLLKGDPASSVAQAMGEAYRYVLQNYPNINVVIEQFHSGWSAEAALMTAENAITATEGNIDAFVASADVLALGIMPAVRAAGLDGTVFISGMDCEIPAMQLIDQGVMTISVWTKIDQQARQAVEAAYNLIRGRPVEYNYLVTTGQYEIRKISVPILGITRDNLEDWVDNIAPPGWITREDVFVN